MDTVEQLSQFDVKHIKKVSLFGVVTNVGNSFWLWRCDSMCRKAEVEAELSVVMY